MIRNRIFAILSLCFIIIFNVTSVMAAGEQTAPLNRGDVGFVETTEPYDTGIPDVTMGQVTNKVERKGFEVVEFLQRIANPLMLIMFIIGCIMVVLGFIFRGPTLQGGVMVILFSAICYAVIMYAPEIMDAFVNWTRA